MPPARAPGRGSTAIACCASAEKSSTLPTSSGITQLVIDGERRSAL
jgi:hypothetical protein